MYLIHGVTDAITTLHQLLWIMDHVMVHADSVDPELYIISATLRYHITDNQRLEPPNGIQTKLMRGKRKDPDWVCFYQLMRFIK